jgi:hypothetical protein
MRLGVTIKVLKKFNLRPNQVVSEELFFKLATKDTFTEFNVKVDSTVMAWWKSVRSKYEGD